MFWEFYKKGVASNVKSYINRLDDNDEYELNENDKMSLDFRNALESIKAW